MVMSIEHAGIRDGLLRAPGKAELPLPPQSQSYNLTAPPVNAYTADVARAMAANSVSEAHQGSTAFAQVGKHSPAILHLQCGRP